MDFGKILIIVLVGFGILAFKDELGPQPESSAYAMEISQANSEPVVLYSTAWCGYCKKTVAYLEKEKIPFIEYDIEKSVKAKSEYDQLNGRGVPLVVIDGNIIRGYNPNKISKLL